MLRQFEYSPLSGWFHRISLKGSAINKRIRASTRAWIFFGNFWYCFLNRRDRSIRIRYAWRSERNVSTESNVFPFLLRISLRAASIARRVRTFGTSSTRGYAANSRSRAFITVESEIPSPRAARCAAFLVAVSVRTLIVVLVAILIVYTLCIQLQPTPVERFWYTMLA